MKQYEAVIKTMEENGGYATLKYLNVNVLNTPHVVWKTKTPFASIRRIVQDTRFFFKIRPGLWALKDYRQKFVESGVKTYQFQRWESLPGVYTGTLVCNKQR